MTRFLVDSKDTIIKRIIAFSAKDNFISEEIFLNETSSKGILIKKHHIYYIEEFIDLRFELAIGDTITTNLSGAYETVEINNNFKLVMDDTCIPILFVKADKGYITICNSYQENVKAIIEVNINSTMFLVENDFPIARINLAPISVFGFIQNNTKYQIIVKDMMTHHLIFHSIESLAKDIDLLVANAGNFFFDRIQPNICKNLGISLGLPDLIIDHIGSYIIGDYVDYSKIAIGEGCQAN